MVPVGYAHLNGQVKFATEKANMLLYWHMRDYQPRPRGGDSVKLKYKSGQLAVSVVSR